MFGWQQFLHFAFTSNLVPASQTLLGQAMNSVLKKRQKRPTGLGWLAVRERKLLAARIDIHKHNTEDKRLRTTRDQFYHRK
jgi:hypothetical protein